MWLGFPQKMRDELINRGVETRPSGGWDYPKPVPVLMEEGGKFQQLPSRLLGTGLQLPSCSFLPSLAFFFFEEKSPKESSQVFVRERGRSKAAVAHAQMHASLSTRARTAPLPTTARIRE